MNPRHHQARLLENRLLAPGAHELVFTRGDFRFRAGEEIQLHGREPADDRTYSLAGGEQEPVLRIIFRVIPAGAVTPRLAALEPGAGLAFTGPFGSFTLRDPTRPLWFIATGTGLAPLLSFVRTRADLRPTVLHGVRAEAELYARSELEKRCAAYHPCVSQGSTPRHVTDVLPLLAWPDDAHFYLCGRNDMITAVQHHLRARGVTADRIFHEPYFFW